MVKYYTDSRPKPKWATTAPPGSIAKMIVMQLRLMRGEELHHPDDNRVVDERLINPFMGERAYQGGGMDTGLDLDLGDVA